MPRHIDSRVTSLSRWSSGRASPTLKLIAESPCQPSTMAPKSTDTRSPAASARAPGTPCTISSLTEMQVTAGNGGMPQPPP